MKAWQSNKAELVAWCKQNQLFVVVLLAELLLIGVMFIGCLAPKTVIDLPLNDWVCNAPGGNVTVQDDGSLLIENPPELVQELTLTSPGFVLVPGGYRLRVDYTSISNLAEPSHSMHHETVVFSCLTTPADEDFFYSEKIYLKDATNTIESGAWVWFGKPAVGVQAQLSYNGTGRAVIEGISFEESVALRWVRLMGMLLLIGIVNAVYYLFFSQGSKKVTERLKKSKTALCLLFIAFLASLPAFADYIYLGNDIHFHLARIASVAQELRNGQFPVRIMTEMLGGHGYANPLFYCDIFLYLSAALYAVMLPLQTCYQIYLIVVNITAAFIAYYCFEKMMKDWQIAMVGTSLYLLGVHRLLNMHTRAAVGEFTAMSFLPLVVLGLWNIYQNAKPKFTDWLPLALGMAGVLQCHVLSVEMIAFFIAAICLLCIKQTFTISRIKAFVGAVFLTLALSTWFLVPFVQSMLTMELRVMGTESYDLQKSGTYLVQLFSLLGGTIVSSIAGVDGESIYIIGWPLIIGLLGAFYCMAKRGEWKLEEKWHYQVLRLSVLLSLGAILLTMQIFPWSAIQPIFGTKISQLLLMVQFPWRYLTLATILLCVVAMMVMAIVKEKDGAKYRALVAVLLATNVLVMGVYYATYITGAKSQQWRNFTAPDTMAVSGGEYLLAGTSLEGLYITKVETSSDEMQVERYRREDGVGYITCQNNGTGEGYIIAPITAYPNYQAVDTVTGQNYPITASEGQNIQVALPAGYAGTIAVEYVSPLLWRVAELISLLSAGGLVVVLYWNKRKNKAA